MQFALSMAESEHCPRGSSREAQPADSGEVDSEVENIVASCYLDGFHRRYGEYLANRRDGLRLEDGVGRPALSGDVRDGSPGGGVEGGQRPAGLLEARVVACAIVNRAFEYRASVRLPGLGGTVRENHLGPVAQRRLEHQFQSGDGFAVIIRGIKLFREGNLISPSVSQQRAQRVGARVEEWEGVVGGVVASLIVAGPADA
mmetsp:Transcript_2492/g.4599  ORF Transcript_2492/g.4599 Transcript_2492/m.4599 type:complete len:201 (+) Transcript_2492:1958-2560(+)